MRAFFGACSPRCSRAAAPQAPADEVARPRNASERSFWRVRADRLFEDLWLTVPEHALAREAAVHRGEVF